MFYIIFKSVQKGRNEMKLRMVSRAQAIAAKTTSGRK
jgi:hypothetical protein